MTEKARRSADDGAALTSMTGLVQLFERASDAVSRRKMELRPNEGAPYGRVPDDTSGKVLVCSPMMGSHLSDEAPEVCERALPCVRFEIQAASPEGHRAAPLMRPAEGAKPATSQSAFPGKGPFSAQPSSVPEGGLTQAHSKTTTLVVRNIPANITQEDLLRAWGEDGSFDFLHLPFNLRKKCSCGYAFVNFVSPELALTFQSNVQNSRLGKKNGKCLDIVAAEAQGRDANMELFKKSRKLTRMPFVELLPVLFNGQVRLSSEEVLEMLGKEDVQLRTITMSVPSKALSSLPHGGPDAM